MKYDVCKDLKDIFIEIGYKNIEIIKISDIIFGLSSTERDDNGLWALSPDIIGYAISLLDNIEVEDLPKNKVVREDKIYYY